MANPNTDYQQRTIVALGRVHPKTVSTIENGNAITAHLASRGRKMPDTGGTQIEVNMDFAENASYGAYTGDEVLNIEQNEFLTKAVFPRRYHSIAIGMNGQEQVENEGPTRVIDLLAAKQRNATKTAANQVAVELYSNGTLYDGKGFYGLQLLLPRDPSAVAVGGIPVDDSPALNEFWRPKFTDTEEINASSTIVAAMKAFAISCSTGKETPDLILCNEAQYTAYEATVIDMQRITDEEEGVTGFSSLRLRFANGNAKVVYDPLCPAKSMFFVRTGDFEWRVHPKRDWTPSPKVQAWAQDAWRILQLHAGNLVCTKRKNSGVLFDAD